MTNIKYNRTHIAFTSVNSKITIIVSKELKTKRLKNIETEEEKN